MQCVEPNIEKVKSMELPLQQEFMSESHLALAEQPTIQLIQKNRKKSHAIILAHPKTNEDTTDMVFKQKEQQDFEERGGRFFPTTADEEKLNTDTNENCIDQVRCC